MSSQVHQQTASEVPLKLPQFGLLKGHSESGKRKSSCDRLLSRSILTSSAELQLVIAIIRNRKVAENAAIASVSFLLSKLSVEKM